MEKIHFKYIDDMMAAESIHLKEELSINPNPVRPLNYHERTEHFLPPEKCEMQIMIDELKEYADTHDMVINKRKTKAIMFNQARNYDFQTAIRSGGRNQIIWSANISNFRIILPTLS